MILRDNLRPRASWLLICFSALLLIMPACGALPALESMPPEPFGVVLADVKDVTSRATANLIRHGKATPEEVRNVAAVLELAINDPLTTAGPTLLADALKRAGLDDADVLDAIALVDIALRHSVSMGPLGSPLGLNAKALLETVVLSLRDAAAAGGGPALPSGVAVEHGSPESR